MTDSVPITPGSGRNIAVDAGQTMPDNTTADVQFVESFRSLYQTPWQTPTITATTYTTIGMAVGGLITFPNCVRRAGGSGTIVNILGISEADALYSVQLLLFNDAPTDPGDQVAFSPAVADLEKFVTYFTMGFAEFSTPAYGVSSLVNAQNWSSFSLPFVAAGSDLYGLCLTTSTNTPFNSTHDLHFALVIVQD